MAFMVPVVDLFTQDEAEEILAEDEWREDGEELAGYYSRLSASGYMDCTDWSGPYKTAAEALKACCEQYEVDEYGDNLSEGGAA